MKAPIADRREMLVISVVMSVAAAMSTASAVEQANLPEGIFFEAEGYDRGPIGDIEFGKRIEEGVASDNHVLIGMWREGMIIYNLDMRRARSCHLWLRYAAPAGGGTLKWGVNAKTTEDLGGTAFEGTIGKGGSLSAPKAYRWMRLGSVALPKGETAIVVGTGALRPDCFFVSYSRDYVPDDDLPARALKAAEALDGEPLPELVHERYPGRRPKWIKEKLRVAYAHYEWDPLYREDPAKMHEAWCLRCVESGANVVMAAGEMPTGTVDGKLRKFQSRKIFEKDFEFPPAMDFSYAWTREFVEVAHRHGLKMTIYGGAHRTLDPLLVENRDWCMRHGNGTIYPGFGSWNGPYRRAYIDRWVKVARLSGMDGIMIDMLFTCPWGGDYSQWTVEAFREKFGVDPPPKEDLRKAGRYRSALWQRWMDFQAWSREEMLIELTEALHAVNPECAVYINQTEGWIFGGPEGNTMTTRVARCVDGLLEEMGWERIHAWHRPWAWPIQGPWQNLFLRSRTHEGGGQGQMWHLVGGARFPAVHVESLWHSMLANGIQPAVVVGGNWPEITAALRHTRECEGWIVGSELVPHAALHFGEDTLYWYANARGEEIRDEYMKNVFGIFQAMLEHHIPVEIVTDDDLLSRAKLARYAVVVLPNSACLSDAQAEALEGYARNGGGIVASFETGKYDENGTPRETPALAGLIGATQGDVCRATDYSFRLPGDERHAMLQHPEFDSSGNAAQGHLESRRSCTLYSGPKSRKVGAVFIRDALPEVSAAPMAGSIRRAGRTRAPAGHKLLSFCARKVGAGRIAFFPIDIGHAYYVFNHQVLRRLVSNSIRWAASRHDPLRTDALMKVQTVMYEMDDAVIVHLVNEVSSFGRAAAPNPEAFTAFRCEVAPVHDIKVAVRGSYGRAMFVPGSTPLAVRTTDGYTEATVPKVRIHGMVVFRR